MDASLDAEIRHLYIPLYPYVRGNQSPAETPHEVDGSTEGQVSQSVGGPPSSIRVPSGRYSINSLL
jgi:hypothetical protein